MRDGCEIIHRLAHLVSFVEILSAKECPRCRLRCVRCAQRSVSFTDPGLSSITTRLRCYFNRFAQRSVSFTDPGSWCLGSWVVLCQRPPRRRYQSKKREKVGLVWSWTVNRKVVVLDHHPEKPWVLDPRGPRETVLDRNLGVFRSSQSVTSESLAIETLP